MSATHQDYGKATDWRIGERVRNPLEKDTQLTFRIRAEQKEFLKGVAERRGITLGEVVRQVLTQFELQELRYERSKSA